MTKPTRFYVALGALVAIFASGCGARPTPAPSAPAKGGGGPVSVLYAGSLVNLMEHDLGPAFQQATGDAFQGVGGGSGAIANQIKGKLRRADVFISAAPNVNDSLMGTSNGDWVSWYATFAEAPLVIGYNPKSRFAADLKSRPWYEVMAEPGFRLGRTDPKLDPKGKLTVDLVNKAAEVYHQPGLTQKLLGAADNPAQVFPEEDLVGRLQAGQLDAGFFYSNEAAEAGIPTVAPGQGIDLKAVYTVAIVRDGPNPQGGTAFVHFLLGPDGQTILQKHGLHTLSPKVSGNAAAVPAELQSVLKPS